MCVRHLCFDDMKVRPGDPVDGGMMLNEITDPLVAIAASLESEPYHANTSVYVCMCVCVCVCVLCV